MKKVLKGAKKGVKIAVEHKIKVIVITLAIIFVSVYFFWADIVQLVTHLYVGFKKNWIQIAFGLFLYKFAVLVFYNLTKRYAINRSVDRFKKTLIYSELDELLSVYVSIKSDDFKKKFDFLERIPYFGYAFKKVKVFIFWGIGLITSAIALIKFGLGKILLAKVLSAQFWTAILIWISDIPGFFTFFGIAIWIWMEHKVPFIPKSYYWLSMKFRYLFDPIWDSFIVPLAGYVSRFLSKLEEKLIYPIGDWIDRLEIKLIVRLKEYIYFKKGERDYRRYMKVVKAHNAEQLLKKKEKDEALKARKALLLKKREETLKKMQEKKEKKQKQNDEN